MLLAKLKIGAAALVAVGLGVGAIAYGVGSYQPAAAQPAQPGEDPPKAQANAPGKSTPAKLEGAWKFESMIEDGKERPFPPDGPPRLFFSKDGTGHFALGDEAIRPFTYKTDFHKTPCEIDMTLGAERKVEGILSIDGDVLKICGSDAGMRPTAFASKEGSKTVLMTLKRDPNAKATAAKPGDVDKVKIAAARARSVNNMKQLMLAMHNHYDLYRGFPATAVVDKNGKPLLSWRVAILPFIEHDALYKAFRLDEPWDSEHNKKLLAQMPKVYGDKGTKTHYRIFVGQGAAFEGTKSLKLPDFTDGTSNTIMMVEAADAVDWTKPEEFEFAADKKLPKLGGVPFEKGFHAALADGSVRFLPITIAEKKLRAYLTRNGGEVIDPE